MNWKLKNHNFTTVWLKNSIIGITRKKVRRRQRLNNWHNKRQTLIEVYTYGNNYYCYALYLLSAFLLAKSLHLHLQISATYRLVSYLLADN